MQGPTGSPPSTAESKALVEAIVEQDGGDWETRWAGLGCFLGDVLAFILKPTMVFTSCSVILISEMCLH